MRETEEMANTGSLLSNTLGSQYLGITECVYSWGKLGTVPDPVQFRPKGPACHNW